MLPESAFNSNTVFLELDVCKFHNIQYIPCLLNLIQMHHYTIPLRLPHHHHGWCRRQECQQSTDNHIRTHATIVFQMHIVAFNLFD